MAITRDQALAQLNFTSAPSDTTELDLYVEAANEWVASKVDDPSSATATLAALFLVDHWWSTQRGPVASPLDDEDEVVEIRGTTYAIPLKVLDLLDLKPNPQPLGSFPDAVGWPDPVEWLS